MLYFIREDAAIVKIIILVMLVFMIIISVGCEQNIEYNPEAAEMPEAQIPPTPEKTVVMEPTPESTISPELTPEFTYRSEAESELIQEYPSVFGFIDAHADTISRALLHFPVIKSFYDSDLLHVDFKRLSEFKAPVQVFVAWIPEESLTTAFDTTNFMFDFFEKQVEEHSDIIEIAYDLDDIRRISGEGKISAILAIEGGEALEGKIENLEHFYNRGVRILGLTWNRENELGFGLYADLTQGLKPFGKEVIRKMDELGMIMDVSHLNNAGFWDAHNTSTRPYMASHSNSHTVRPHPRNLGDDQIMAIVESGGIIGFNMYPSLVGPGEVVTTNDIMAHLHHFIQIGAGSNIGLGCDFDGIPGTPEGITGVESLKAFGGLLVDEFNKDYAYKIMEGNFYDFFVRYFEAKN